MRRHIRKDEVVEYDIVIIVIIHSYSYKNIESNDEIVKLIATAWRNEENTSNETLGQCQQLFIWRQNRSNRIWISQRSVGTSHVNILRSLEEIITNLKLTDLDCEIIVED